MHSFDFSEQEQKSWDVLWCLFRETAWTDTAEDYIDTVVWILKLLSAEMRLFLNCRQFANVLSMTLHRNKCRERLVSTLMAASVEHATDLTLEHSGCTMLHWMLMDVRNTDRLHTILSYDPDIHRLEIFA